MSQAACDRCQTVFQVPDLTRTYRCRKCGGAIRAEDPQPADDADAGPAESSVCEACGEQVDPAAAFCEACGVALSDEAGADPDERRVANRELAKAKDAAGVVRTFYLLGAVLAGVSVIAMLALLVMFPVTPALLLLTAIALVALCGYVMGVRSVMLRPMLWSVLIASYETVNALLAAVTLRIPLLVVPKVLWALAMWMMVLPIARVRRFIERYPELWYARANARRNQLARGTSAARLTARGRREQSTQQRRRRILIGSLIAVPVTAVLIVGVRIALRPAPPPPFDVTLAAFEQAWNGQRRNEIAAFFQDERRDEVRSWLAKSNSRRDWSAALPEIQDRSIDASTATQRGVGLMTMDGDLRMTWIYQDGAWRARTISLR